MASFEYYCLLQLWPLFFLGYLTAKYGVIFTGIMIAIQSTLHEMVNLDQCNTSDHADNRRIELVSDAKAPEKKWPKLYLYLLEYKN